MRDESRNSCRASYRPCPTLRQAPSDMEKATDPSGRWPSRDRLVDQLLAADVRSSDTPGPMVEDTETFFT